MSSISIKQKQKQLETSKHNNNNMIHVFGSQGNSNGPFNKPYGIINDAKKSTNYGV